MLRLQLLHLLDLVPDQPVYLVPGQTQRIHGIKIDGAVAFLSAGEGGEGGEQRHQQPHHHAVTDLWSL